MRYALLPIIFIVVFNCNSACAQQSKGAKTAAQIELSILPGLEMPPRASKYWLDTANFRPENFSFRIWDKMDLTDRLEAEVPLPPISCNPSWGLFIFRVNGTGKVDSTWYRGNLPAITSDKILKNICSTEGNWIIKPGTKPGHVAWFVYPFFDTRGRFPKRPECSQTDQQLLDAVSALSNLFAILSFQVGRDYYRATLLRTTNMDGSIKL